MKKLLLILLIYLGILCCKQTNNININKKSENKSKLEEICKNKIVLIVNGDDLGITKIFTDATIDAYFKGGISSTSIVATGHDVERAIRILKKYPDLSVGIHLTLNGDWKPLTSGKSLCNASGLMWDTVDEVRENVIPDEALTEWDAQIKKIIDAGINVTHIDSHMGCYFLSPELFKAAYSLAKKYKIPLISPYYGQVPKEEKKFFSLTSYTGIYRLENQEETLENRTKAYWKMFEKFKHGIYYIYTHQGLEPSNKIITGDLDLRINEYKFWTGENTKKQLSKKGYIIISSTLLKEEFQKVLMGN